MSGSMVTDMEEVREERPVRREVAKVVRQKQPWNFVAAALILLLAATAILGLAHNKNIEWNVFAAYVFSPLILSGLVTTIELSALALALGMIVGTFVAIARMSKNIVISSVAACYVWLLRGLPGIVQLLFWGNIALFVREITIGVPFTDITFGTFQLNAYIKPFVAAVIGLGLAESAYMSEIIRGGISSIDKGQFEASAALGMGWGRTMRRIIMPQAMRSIVPALGNQLATVIKASALVSVIAGGELLTNAQNIAAENYRIMELLFVASFWYLILLAITGLIQRYLERRMRRSER